MMMILTALGIFSPKPKPNIISARNFHQGKWDLKNSRVPSVQHTLQRVTLLTCKVDFKSNKSPLSVEELLGYV
jgi:hypothetical protein